MSGTRQPESAEALLATLPEPLSERLEAVRRAALRVAAPVWWVGGGVRDLLRGAPTADLDLVVEGPEAADLLARSLTDELGGRLHRHERFRTATLTPAEGAGIDIAATRAECYPSPGALPRVEPAGLDQDLLRRDFTINAIALRLAPEPAVLRDPTGGRADLASGTLRVLHDGSFRDDPTRILRGLRFERRFGFRFAEASETLARAALESGALETLSAERLRGDLAPLFESPEALAPAFACGARLGLWSALDPALRGAESLLERAAAVAGAAALLPWAVPEPGAPGGWRLALLLLAEELPAARRRILGTRLGGDAGERKLANEGPENVARAVRLLARVPAPPAHAVARTLARSGPEELAAVAARGGAAREWVLRHLTELRLVRLRVRGADLVAAGLVPGPAVRRALDRTLDARLDGRIGTEEELDFALATAREAGR